MNQNAYYLDQIDFMILTSLKTSKSNETNKRPQLIKHIRDDFVSHTVPLEMSDWLLFCCGNLVLYQKKK